MPALYDTNSGRATTIKPKAKPVKAKRKAKPRPATPTPDQADRTRAANQRRITASQTPDTQDRNRTPAQKAHDAAVTKRVVRESREKALAKRNRGSGTRAVKAFIEGGYKAHMNTMPSTAGGLTVVTVSRKRGGGGPQFATVKPLIPRTVAIDDTTAAGRFIRNAPGDAMELAVTTPTSMAHLAKTAVTEPEKVPGMLAQPYKDFAKDPVGEFIKRPVSTTLLVAPAVRMPGRAAGRAARIAGKQTLERPAAQLPGTALRERRTGSRDLVVRAIQSRQDRKSPPPTVTDQQIRRRVDEHFDYARQHETQAERRAAREAWKQSKGKPKAERQRAVEEAAEQARDRARAEMEERFAREFGANARPSTGHADREAAHVDREAAITRHDDARDRLRKANAAHDQALADARRARARQKTSPTLSALETRRRDAQRDLARAQRAHGTARASLGVARGRAQVLSRNVGGRAGGYGVQLATRELDTAAQAVRDARATIRDLDGQIAGERARIAGVPPAEHQRLVRAIADRDHARGEVTAARAQADTARSAHVRAKKDMAGATLVDAAAEGRLFAHKADAAKVAQRLNEHGTQLRTGSHAPAHYEVLDDGTVKLRRTPGGPSTPLEFVVRDVGDQFAVVPKAAAQQLVKHHAVGSSKATPAKVMKRSRAAFTQAVLPLSLKWLAGQGIEAGMRSAVAGAGPMDLLRTSRVVRELNKQRPGAGDELLTRITGGQFELTGPARDFARGKSLAEEFNDTSLGQPAAALTHAANTPPLRAVRAGWRRYTDVVVGSVNSLFEHTARKAMVGQSLKNSPLLERRINGLSDKAITDAANGLRGTDAQVELARAVDRMYGRYSKFSPEMRSLLLHWSPFLPWYLNVATFLTKVLPVDHPIQASLIAATSTATEEWRKTAGLSLRYGEDGSVPDFLLGRYPAKNGKLFPVAKYTPFGIGSDVGGATAGLMLPQLLGPVKNLAGDDWAWRRLKHPGYAGEEFDLGERTIRALVTAAESQVPGVSQAGRISGLTARHVDKKTDIPPLRERLARELPWTPAAPGAAASSGTTKRSSGPRVKAVRVKPVRVKPIKIKPVKVR